MAEDGGAATGNGPESWPLGRLLSTAGRVAEQAWNDRLRALGLSHAVVVVLHHLVDREASPEQLARSVRVTPQTMSSTLERMHRDGLIERARSEHDRRRTIVRLTEHGRSAWVSAREVESGVLGDVEDDALRAALVRIVRSAS